MADQATKKVASAKKADTSTEKSLSGQLADKRADLLAAKKSLRAGELVNPRVISGYRKEIARILTQINTKESK